MLIDCIECGHKISTTAKKCPKCGGMQVKQPTKILGTIIIVVIVGFLIFDNLK